ncbi:hypothetical protein WOLCODRAFT_140699 [Wolfiporia cocos MD-104 SS10]|uniref:ER transporter 6TM N-terminal domain-containing protein n=1 Tax=Wolfiporia cocos (strain MD-104) TaxID=742152 RepID=A0A2H3J5W0_WOLCO|nr:hypothetical protein WOLCODRAFT_140699 [Wolfiporia cocos MD-104 SS10]
MSSAASSGSPRPSMAKGKRPDSASVASSSPLDKLPAWVSTNLRSRRSWKTLVRCWIASWVSFVIILPDKSLRTLGNAAFFALIGSMIMPPNMPIQMFLFAMMTLVIGLCLGWAFGAAAMRAALAVRNEVLVRQTLQKVQQSAAGLADPDALYVVSIFRGAFLDTHSTVLFGVFLGVGAFLFALMRAYAPRLIIMSVFGTIALDILCSYGPLFPIPQYTLLNSILTPLACYVAIGMILISLFFPESLNHSLLNSASELLGQIQTLVVVQDEVLTTPASELLPGGTTLTKVTSVRDEMLTGLQGFISQLSLINLEFSWGKWNGDDVKSLDRPLAAVASRLAALQGFAKLLGKAFDGSAGASRASVDGTRSANTGAGAGADASANTAQGDMLGDAEVIMQLRNRHRSTGPPISDVIPVLRDATRELREACAGAAGACRAVIISVNTKRYGRDAAANLDANIKALDAAEERLAGVLTAFKERDRLALVEPFRDVLDEERQRQRADKPALGQRATEAPLRALYLSYVFAANMVAVAQAVKALVESVGETATRRRKNRLWAPKGLRMIGKALTQRGNASDQATGEDPVPPEETGAKEREERQYRRDPDGRPPSNIFQHAANVLHAVYQWAKTPEAMFAFKYALLTIALWIPQVCKSSAGFVYDQKGVWALIMAQTTLNIYAADQIWNYMLRLLGTFIGALYGLVCWYIGSARGNGNPYGLAACVGVFLVPVMFARLFAPMQVLPGVLMVATTFALVVGYSWLDGHLVIVGNVGIGWSVAWRRWVLVTIGCVASFIVMILPPSSARKSVRLRCASTISSLSYIYSHLMAAWIDDAEAGKEEQPGFTATRAEWIAVFREKLISVVQQIQALRSQAAIAKFEGSIRGAWPYKEYNRLVEVESEMAGNLAVIGGSLVQLEPQTRIALLRHTKVINPNFISDVMSAFLLISQSLRTGEPLHQTQYQNLVDRVFYHGDADLPSLKLDEELRDSMRIEQLESVSSYEYMFYASAVVAVFQLLLNLNEARSIAAELCGEVPMEGFGRWKERHDRVSSI